MSEPRCHECGIPVSYETGFSMTGGLGDNSQDRLWCPEHAPKQGKGYTLSDLQQMKEESQVARADREMQLMDQVGADVFFAVQAGRERAQRRAHLRRVHRVTQRMTDSLKEIGVID